MAGRGELLRWLTKRPEGAFLVGVDSPIGAIVAEKAIMEHIAGKQVLPLEEFLGKLKAAVDARNEIDKSQVIIARTDGYHAAGFRETPGFDGDLDEIVRRCRAFFEAGADAVWPEFENAEKK